VLRDHCAHARFVWNLAVEQQAWWRAGRGGTPGYSEQCRQLTDARAEFGWLRDGCQMVQQQALRDFSQAMANFVAGAHGRPTWRKAKVSGRVERVNPAFTSQRCSACGHIAAESRKSQALFICVACGLTLNADVNAAKNIAAGHAVTARGGYRVNRPANREPQLLLQSA
jgi:hypothetical protein